MKALSLWEPWATFIAKGWKTIETRSWSTPYRGPIAIHAAKTRRGLDEDEVLGILQDAGVPLKELNGHRWPLGCIVATATLERCEPTELLELTASRADLAMGNFSDGRFGWVLKNVKPLETPIPFRGMQGLFGLPLDILEVIAGRAPVPAAPPPVKRPSRRKLPLFDEKPRQTLGGALAGPSGEYAQLAHDRDLDRALDGDDDLAGDFDE